MSRRKEPRIDTEHLSGALRQAIDDMDERIESGDYTPNGVEWHMPPPHSVSTDEYRRCNVCLAGALFQRFGTLPSDTTSPTRLSDDGLVDDEELQMLACLDSLRHGNVVGAIHRLKPALHSGEILELGRAVARTWLEGEEEYRGDGIPTEVLAVRFMVSRYLRKWKTGDRTRYLRLADALEAHGL